MPYRLARSAQDQIDAVLLTSARKHGIDAATRYGRLIRSSMEAIAEDPQRPGSSDIPRVAGVRAYFMSAGRLKIEPGERVGSPRHLIVYRVAADGVVEILGVAHDRMLLSRAARKAIRDAGKA